MVDTRAEGDELIWKSAVAQESNGMDGEAPASVLEEPILIGSMDGRWSLRVLPRVSC